jgi:CheY-like chemotaxis protein
MLINDILDLSKIESGTVVVDPGELRFADMRTFVQRTFQHVADAKGLGFGMEFEPDLPPSMFTDVKRLQQVVKNLLSNAFKFTERGEVSLRVGLVREGWSGETEGLDRADAVLAFSVRDTGIGISAQKQQIIFEAFQQADGSTSRRYGGTGLGLAISREIARLLGGDIRVSSSPGEGSTFTLFLPRTYVPPKSTRKSAQASVSLLEAPAPALRELEREPEPELSVSPPRDDRQTLQPGDRVLLIVDNDERFTELALEMAREHGWKALVTESGAAAVALASEFRPDAMTLDLRLPDIDGLRVLQRLKADPETRHIRVQVISTDDGAYRGFAFGAAGVLRKPLHSRDALDAALRRLLDQTERPPRDVLLLSASGDEFVELLEGTGARVRRVETWSAADAEALPLACVLVDARFARASTLDLAREIRDARGDLPVLVYGPADQPGPGRVDTELAARRGIMCAATPEDLLDRVLLLLHQPLDALSALARKRIEQIYASSRVLAGRKALVVDDDVRNIYALTSVLENEEMSVLAAESGQAAIEILEHTPDIDIVLMDIMMPGMDGFDTMRAIRKMPGLRTLPIVAVTAKAMKGDHERTLEAGAWSYLSKPVEPERMLRAVRAWLRR